MLRLLYPESCSMCRVSLAGTDDHQHFICRDCIQLFLAKSNYCHTCGSQLIDEEAEYQKCSFCAEKRFKFDQVFCLGAYEGTLKKAILRAKVSSGAIIGKALGGVLADQLKENSSEHRFDWIIPVPSHWTRRIVRGYNSSEVISREISQNLGVQYNRRVLFLQRNPRKQSELRFSARWQNVHQAFVVKRGYDIQGTKVLLVDDILTSGATASESARVLKEAGAAEVSVAVAGRALFQNTTN